MNSKSTKSKNQSWPQAFAELRGYLKTSYQRTAYLERQLMEIAEIAEEGRQSVNDCATKFIPSEIDSAAAVTRGHFMSIANKALASLSPSSRA